MEKTKFYTQEEVDIIIKKEKWKREDSQFIGAAFGYLLGLLVCTFIL